MSKYRGKYPHKIKEVWTDLGICYVRTNCGVTYQLVKTVKIGALPSLGMDVYAHNGFDYKPRFAKGL